MTLTHELQCDARVAGMSVHVTPSPTGKSRDGDRISVSLGLLDTPFLPLPSRLIPSLTVTIVRPHQPVQCAHPLAEAGVVEVVTPAGGGAELGGVVAGQRLVVALEHTGNLHHVRDVDVGQDLDQLVDVARRHAARLTVLQSVSVPHRQGSPVRRRTGRRPLKVFTAQSVNYLRNKKQMNTRKERKYSILCVRDKAWTIIRTR